MKRLTVWTVFLGAWLLLVPTAYALTMAYGQRDIERAGVGCVGGWISGHSNVAYFRGNTEMLSRKLAEVSRSGSSHHPPKIVLHAGEKFVENPSEQPLTGYGEKETNQMRIDWSVRRTCPANVVLQGRCKCDRRSITIDVWISRDVTLDALAIPPGFMLKSGREIEEFIERQSASEWSGNGEQSDATRVGESGVLPMEDLSRRPGDR